MWFGVRCVVGVCVLVCGGVMVCYVMCVLRFGFCSVVLCYVVLRVLTCCLYCVCYVFLCCRMFHVVQCFLLFFVVGSVRSCLVLLLLLVFLCLCMYLYRVGLGCFVLFGVVPVCVVRVRDWFIVFGVSVVCRVVLGRALFCVLCDC